MLVNDARDFASLFDVCDFIYVKRSCNKAVHTIAKVSLIFEEALLWLDARLLKSQFKSLNRTFLRSHSAKDLNRTYTSRKMVKCAT